MDIKAKGANPKALQKLPALDDVELFYYDLYILCAADFSILGQVAGAYGLTPDELVETIQIFNIIKWTLRDTNAGN